MNIFQEDNKLSVLFGTPVEPGWKKYLFVCQLILELYLG